MTLFSISLRWEPQTTSLQWGRTGKKLAGEKRRFRWWMDVIVWWFYAFLKLYAGDQHLLPYLTECIIQGNICYSIRFYHKQHASHQSCSKSQNGRNAQNGPKSRQSTPFQCQFIDIKSAGVTSLSSVTNENCRSRPIRSFLKFNES